MRNLQRRLCGFEIVIFCERLLDQIIELFGVKQCPPIADDIFAIAEVLRFAAGNMFAVSVVAAGWGE